jgi:hypothetical protein
LVIVISYGLTQSDHIEQLILCCKISIKHGVCIQLKANTKILNLTNVKDNTCAAAASLSYQLNLRRHFDSSDLASEKVKKKFRKIFCFKVFFR